MAKQRTTDKPVWVLNSNDPARFAEECCKLIEDGYTLSSSSCGFVNSEAYDFCDSYQAIFVKHDREPVTDNTGE